MQEGRLDLTFQCWLHDKNSGALNNVSVYRACEM